MVSGLENGHRIDLRQYGQLCVIQRNMWFKVVNGIESINSANKVLEPPIKK